MKHYYVYILKCWDGTYYVGTSSNLEARLLQHETAFYPKCYTATRLPVILVFWERFYHPLHAIQFEKQLKGWSRKKKDALIARNWARIKDLAVCRNSSSHKFLNEDHSSKE